MENRVAGLEQRSVTTIAKSLRTKAEIKKEESVKMEFSAIATTPAVYNTAADVVKSTQVIFAIPVEVILSFFPFQGRGDGNRIRGTTASGKETEERQALRSNWISHCSSEILEKKKKKKETEGDEMHITTKEETALKTAGDVKETSEGTSAAKKSKKKRKSKDDTEVETTETPSKKQKKEESAKKKKKKTKAKSE